MFREDDKHLMMFTKPGTYPQSISFGNSRLRHMGYKIRDGENIRSNVSCYL